MAVRDISPSSYAAPGVASLALAITLSNANSDPLPLDMWLSNYSPCSDNYVNLSSGFNQVTVPTDGNARLFVFIPPRGNTTAITLKGVTGDTGILLNPNGPIVLALPASSQPAYIGILAGSAITGCRVLFF